MMIVNGLIDANVHLLQQAQRLLDGMDDGDYAAAGEGVYRSSIGQHLRHCFDHYLSFIAGMPEGVVDYDRREREEEVECQTECACQVLGQLISVLRDLQRNGDLATRTVKVLMDYGGSDNQWQESSVGRELQFLVSHTVHHYAMINEMARQRGFLVENGFGIAPSTLRHRETAGID